MFKHEFGEKWSKQRSEGWTFVISGIFADGWSRRMSMKSIAKVKCVFSLYEFCSKKFLIRSLKLRITYCMKTTAGLMQTGLFLQI